MESHEYTYPVKIDKIVDGDTVYLLCDLGLRCFTYIEGRLARINAPEKNRLKSREAGIAAKVHLETLLDGKSVFIKTEKIKSKTEYLNEKKDSWSRWIIEVYILDQDRFININDEMVIDGHALYHKYK